MGLPVEPEGSNVRRGGDPGIKRKVASSRGVRAAGLEPLDLNEIGDPRATETRRRVHRGHPKLHRGIHRLGHIRRSRGHDTTPRPRPEIPDPHPRRARLVTVDVLPHEVGSVGHDVHGRLRPARGGDLAGAEDGGVADPVVAGVVGGPFVHGGGLGEVRAVIGDLFLHPVFGNDAPLQNAAESLLPAVPRHRQVGALGASHEEQGRPVEGRGIRTQAFRRPISAARPLHRREQGLVLQRRRVGVHHLIDFPAALRFVEFDRGIARNFE
mmetsp:Transcript_35433/g.81169  ORF Transcript_35433/g.81169 Transcript_35433/m.81169 type:complete len:268 (-) Transcript_35433:151-954(-)